MEQLPAEQQENIEKIEKLRSYIEQGYLLHGSKSRIDTLEPRQANDLHREVGNMKGVYATDDLRIAVVMSLFAKKDPNKSKTSSFSSENDGPLYISGENVTLTPGFVHVLPKDTFKLYPEDGGFELVSEEPVVPVDVIEVNPSILDSFPDIIKGEFKD